MNARRFGGECGGEHKGMWRSCQAKLRRLGPRVEVLQNPEGMSEIPRGYGTSLRKYHRLKLMSIVRGCLTAGRSLYGSGSVTICQKRRPVIMNRVHATPPRHYRRSSR